MSEPILRDVFSGWKTGEAIFHSIAAQNFEVPWDWSELPAILLDQDYFGNHSGSKFCAPLVKAFLGDSESLTSSAINSLASLIWGKYHIPWTRLWQTFEVDYNPIHNYNMYEDEETTNENTYEDIIDSDIASSHERTEDTLSSAYGFNSGQPNPADKSEYEEGQSATKTEDTTRNKTDNLSEERNLHRYGNIGVTTSQKMISDERELWLWNYFEQIYSDLDEVLALKFYDPCRV